MSNSQFAVLQAKEKLLNCPMPLRCHPCTDLVDVILTKDEEQSAGFFNGSPPCRVPNPVVNDPCFGLRRGGCVPARISGRIMPAAVRIEGFACLDSAEDEPLRDVKRIREEMIIHILEDDDDAGDRDQMTQDLDTVIKSLQEEITPLPSPQSNDLIPQPDLGYLLEASDDELGLPPAASSPSGDCGGSEEDEVAGFAPIWGYEDEAFDLGFVAIDEPFGFNDALSEPFDLFGGDYADLVF